MLDFGDGLRARAVLGSKVETDTRRSVYDLAGLGRTFDIIQSLGVYHHLHAPLPALAQVRHCCHPGTVVLVDGPVAHGLPDGTALYDFPNHAAEWLPTAGALTQLAEAAYFPVDGRELMEAGTARAGSRGGTGSGYAGRSWPAPAGASGSGPSGSRGPSPAGSSSP
ncbi:MAG: hypothetical protein C0501_11530 [Isosphaera sp.]|nr:hypothetical protein [Isosphaera sp.]